MAQSTALAHTQHADLSVLHTEGLILELTPIDARAELGVLRRLNLAHLDEHALDDAVDVGVQVAHPFVVRSRMAIAQSNKISNGARCNVIEKLEVNRV